MLLALSEAATTGLFVLGGVVVGAVIGAIVQGYFERRREQADLRQAKRLVAGELVRVFVHYDGMLRTSTTPLTLGREARFLPDATWRDHGPILARHLSDDAEYDVLSSFMEALPTTRDLIAGLPAAQPIPPELHESLEDGRRLSAESYRVLTGKNIEQMLP